MEQVIEFLYSDVWTDVWDAKLLQLAFIIILFSAILNIIILLWFKDQADSQTRKHHKDVMEELQKIQQQCRELRARLAEKEVHFDKKE